MSPLAPASTAHRSWECRSVQVGEWRITALADGSMRLDGGSMWGVVPATIWRALTPPDADNTILIALRPFLAQRGTDVVLIEVGVGDRWEEKWRSIYKIDRTDTLDETLAGAGVAPEEVTHVIASHCHFDHVGAQVALRDGRLVPRFPNARHFAPRIEVATAANPDSIRRASYRAEDVEPIAAAGLLETFEGRTDVLPGIRCHPAEGHSDGLCVITIGEDDPGDTAIFWADVVPTAHHVQPPYIMAYDIDVARSFASRSHWLERAAEGGWLGLFYHDPDVAFGRVVRDGRRYDVEVVTGDLREAAAGPGR